MAVVACAVAIAVFADGCARPTALGPSANRVPDVPYEPTPHHVVAEMLKLAQVGANDVVYDLGCGDGRIVIAAAKELGARGVCVDIDPQRIRESRENVKNAGVAERILFLNQDLFDTDIGDATVVTLFLWPSVNLRLRPKLWRELKAGTRIVSYVHDMGANGHLKRPKPWKALAGRATYFFGSFGPTARTGPAAGRRPTIASCALDDAWPVAS